MNELTLQEKLSGAVERAREETTEKHFFDKAQPFFPLGFSVSYRNPGHWDVWTKTCPGRKEAWLAAHPGGEIIASGNESRERAFRIRGEHGNVVVLDERWNPHKPHPRESMKFRSVLSAMLWIVEELMQEPSQPRPPTASPPCSPMGRIMPIRPENRACYPNNWPEIRERIGQRSCWRCECLGECGRGTHDGRCTNTHGGSAYGTGSKVVLTVAHLDHTPEHCEDDNLRHMCQGCHLHYDKDHHAETARATRHSRNPDLFAPDAQQASEGK